MAKTSPAKATKPLIPPEGALWQRYSPHFELPLASATSLFLHGLVIGLLAVGGLAFFFTPNLEATKPPRMDVVMIEGNGTGFEGLGGEPGSPGAPNGGGKQTEQVAPLPDQQPNPGERPPLRFPMDALLDLPRIDDGTPISPELAAELREIGKEAADRITESMKIATPPVSGGNTKKTGPAGTGNPKGVGGKGGPGDGTGAGNKKGPGTGSGGPGRKATDQEIFARRWRFDLTGDPKEHARKLAVVGFIVAIPDANSTGFFIITDLNRRPVEMRKDNLAAFTEAVRFVNDMPQSVQGLARELQLPFAPRFVALFLPKDRERKIADAEAQFARDNGRDLQKVRETRFDFQLRNGAYEPVVKSQK